MKTIRFIASFLAFALLVKSSQALEHPFDYPDRGTKSYGSSDGDATSIDDFTEALREQIRSGQRPPYVYKPHPLVTKKLVLEQVAKAAIEQITQTVWQSFETALQAIRDNPDYPEQEKAYNDMQNALDLNQKMTRDEYVAKNFPLIEKRLLLEQQASESATKAIQAITKQAESAIQKIIDNPNYPLKTTIIKNGKERILKEEYRLP